MYPDRLSIASVPNELPQPARPSNRTEGDTSFASIYAEALEIEEEEVSELESADSSDASASPVEDLPGLLDLRGMPAFGGCGEATPLPAPGRPNGPIDEATLSPRRPTSRANASAVADDRMQAMPASAHREDTGAPSGISRLIHWLDAHAHLHSEHRCAASVRQAMEAAGISTSDRPGSGDAGDYGPFLLRHGAHVVDPASYEPHAGDIAVFEKTEDHPAGHVQVYDGHQWVSDFVQHTFSPYRDQVSTPPVTVYRMS